MDLFTSELRTDPAAQALVRDWIDALRSDEYKQGGGSLYSPLDRSWCCLGVLCDRVRYQVQGRWDEHGVFYAPRKVRIHSACPFESVDQSCPPHSVYGLVYMRAASGDIRDQGRRTSLTTLNDNGVPFSEIADVIEHELQLALA